MRDRGDSGQRLQRSGGLERFARSAGRDAVLRKRTVSLTPFVEHRDHRELFDPQAPLLARQLLPARHQPLRRSASQIMQMISQTPERNPYTHDSKHPRAKSGTNLGPRPSSAYITIMLVHHHHEGDRADAVDRDCRERPPARGSRFEDRAPAVDKGAIRPYSHSTRTRHPCGTQEGPLRAASFRT
jgi:hypothetical protein